MPQKLLSNESLKIGVIMKVHLNNSIQDELCINYYISTAFAC